MDCQATEDLGAYPIGYATHRSYYSKVRSMERYSELARYPYPDYPDLPDVSISDLVQDLCGREDISLETKAGYRNALLRKIQTSSLHEDDKQYEIRLLEAIKLSNSKALAGEREKGISANNRKSRAKKRAISEKDEDALLGYLAAHSTKSVWAHRAHLLVRATDASGLRIVEWLFAELDRERAVLHVQTAKRKATEPAFKRRRGGPYKGESGTQAQADPFVRDIPLSVDDQQFVHDHILEFERAVPKGLSEDARREEFRKYYDQCKCAFSRAGIAVFGYRRYSFKTFRSQFSANMKALHGRVRTAVLMGHSGPDSPSASHYGKANQAHRRFKGRRQKQDEGQRDFDCADTDSRPGFERPRG